MALCVGIAIWIPSARKAGIIDLKAWQFLAAIPLLVVFLIALRLYRRELGTFHPRRRIPYKVERDGFRVEYVERMHAYQIEEWRPPDRFLERPHYRHLASVGTPADAERIIDALCAVVSELEIHDTSADLAPDPQDEHREYERDRWTEVAREAEGDHGAGRSPYFTDGE